MEISLGRTTRIPGTSKACPTPKTAETLTPHHGLLDCHIFTLALSNFDHSDFGQASPRLLHRQLAIYHAELSTSQNSLSEQTTS
jgi:hypothetical protein